ncbi:MAG: RidA family protein [Thermoleophilaceae bacterium]|nr:RidA family protein [Thermoleophilaceae bacterium]
MTKNGITAINPDSLGPAIAPYSQATVAGNLVFIAGQVALDKDNNVIAPGDARAQTVATLERIETLLKEVGGSLSDIATTTVWLTDLSHFAAFNEGWAEKFGDHRPARATLRSDLLIEGLVVEIQATAVLSS